MQLNYKQQTMKKTYEKKQQKNKTLYSIRRINEK